MISNDPSNISQETMCHAMSLGDAGLDASLRLAGQQEP
jgi:hypothetical protein